jgi:hypothetical protein
VKKLFAMLLAVSIAGCMTPTKQQTVKKPSASDGDAAAAVQKQLPTVDPHEITNENGVSKAKELQEELLQESRRMASAPRPDSPN